MTTAAKGKRYSIDMLLYAFNLYHKSPACYEEVRKVLWLHSKHLIRYISWTIRLDFGNVCKILQPNELKVDIHIESYVVYQNGKLVEHVENLNMK